MGGRFMMDRGTCTSIAWVWWQIYDGDRGMGGRFMMDRGMGGRNTLIVLGGRKKG